MRKDELANFEGIDDPAVALSMMMGLHAVNDSPGDVALYVRWLGRTPECTTKPWHDLSTNYNRLQTTVRSAEFPSAK